MHHKIKLVGIDQFEKLVESAIKCKKTTAQWKEELGVKSRTPKSKKSIDDRLKATQKRLEALKKEMVELKKAKAKVAKTTTKKKSTKKSNNIIKKVAKSVA